ncbi:MAG: hypothetical protein ACFCU6_05575 [Balneolaceae bacterium]
MNFNIGDSFAGFIERFIVTRRMFFGQCNSMAKQRFCYPDSCRDDGINPPPGFLFDLLNGVFWGDTKVANWGRL